MAIDFNRLREIFLEAVEQHPPEARPAFLDRVCGGDPLLRAEVELLLRAHGAGDGEVAVESWHAGPAPTQPDSSDWIGKKIGRYKLVERIGDGGMGAVFMAEQTEPIQRRVALKVVKPGMDSRQVLARFEAERQALAMMDHPNIARVLDAGETESGQPYFVMELIKGVPITQFCDERRLSPEERLRLCIPVCRAIQHAHQKGIIHRDVKPSNVLVALHDGVPVPKVIDFGVAKAIRQPLTEKTLFTGFGAIIGTLEYMSPEQAELNQLDIDTRSDVYGLGVLLYELLTGTTPILPERIKRSANLEILRLIREEDPPAPSTRLETTAEIRAISANRGIEPKKLSGMMRGDLDWIVMRCLEKDRNRRYETADRLARDLEHYLSGEPVEAGPPSRSYRLRKFARKNKGLLAATAALAVVLLAGSAVATWLAVRATRAEAVAKEQAEVAQAINGFLQNDLLGRANTGRGADRDLKLRTVLDRAAKKVDDTLGDRPLVQAGVHNTVGAAYTSLGAYAEAAPHLEAAARIYERVLGPSHRDTLATRGNLAILLFRQGRLAEAREIQEQVLAAFRASLGAKSPEAIRAMNNLTNVLLAQGRFEDARKLVEEELPLAREALGAEADSTLTAKGNLARVYSSLGRFEDARTIDENLLETYRRKLGDSHIRTQIAMSNLAVVLVQQHRLEDARKLYVEALDAKTGTLGPEHPSTLITMYNVADLDAASGRNDEARAIFEKVLAVQRKVLGTEHTDTIRSMLGLANVQHRLGNYAASRSLFEEALAAQRAALGKDHPDTLRIMGGLADLDVDEDRTEEARALYDQVLDGYRRTLGLKHPNTLDFTKNFAWILATSPHVEIRDPARALELARDALAVTPEDGNIWNTAGVASYRLGKWDDAIADLRKSMDLRHGGDANDYLFLAMAYWRKDDREEAAAWYRKAVDSMAAGPPPGPELRRFREEADELMKAAPG